LTSSIPRDIAPLHHLETDVKPIRFFCTALAVTALFGCDNLGGKKDKPAGSGSGSGGVATQPSTGPIKVGHFASLTGSESTFGQSTDNAIKLAVQERNAKGGVKGRQIELITLDDASKASEAGNVVQRLISQNGVIAILGEVASGSSINGGKVAQQAGVPMITPSSTNKKVTAGRDMVSRVCFVDEFQGYVVAKFAYDQGMKKVAMLFDQAAPYSKGLADSFKTELTGMGGEIVTSQAFTAGDPDVSAQLQSIKTSGAQAVFLPAYYTDVGNIVNQARKLGITVPFLGGDGWDSVKLAEIGGKAIEGSYYSNHYSFDEDRPEVQEFVKKYQAAYGSTPDGLAALGYDAALVLFDAMERSASMKGPDLRKAIAETKNFTGVTGTFSIDENRNAKKSAVIVEYKDLKQTMAARIEKN
jgi:branched-chain amino acid transport system substrate-binding protein